MSERGANQWRSINAAQANRAQRSNLATGSSRLRNLQAPEEEFQEPPGFDESQFGGYGADTQLNFDHLEDLTDDDQDLQDPYEEETGGLQEQQQPLYAANRPRFQSQGVNDDQDFEDGDNNIDFLLEKANQAQQEADRYRQQLHDARRQSQASQRRMPPPQARPRHQQQRASGASTAPGSQMSSPGAVTGALPQVQASQGHVRRPAGPLGQPSQGYGAPSSQSSSLGHASGHRERAEFSNSDTSSSHPRLLRSGNAASTIHPQPTQRALGKRRASSLDDEEDEDDDGIGEREYQRANKRVNIGQTRSSSGNLQNGNVPQTPMNRNPSRGTEGYFAAPPVAGRSSRPPRRRAAPAEIEAFRHSQRLEALRCIPQPEYYEHSVESRSNLPFDPSSSSSAVHNPSETPTHRAYQTRSHDARGMQTGQRAAIPPPSLPRRDQPHAGQKSRPGKRGREDEEDETSSEEDVKPITKRQRRLREAEEKGIQLGRDNKLMENVGRDDYGEMTYKLNGKWIPAAYHYERRGRLLEIEDAKGAYSKFHTM
ncbi:MAG: hypothetical protein Q9220_002251 [cf. Caloplaca sp. 1 TL-2023]